MPTNRRSANGPRIVVKGARQNNLKDLETGFPIGSLTVVTGVSGSGKSSLVEDVLWKAAAKLLHRASVTPGAHDSIEGFQHVDKVIRVDQAPIGSTPNSNPATYTGVFDMIRELFAKLPESKVRGYAPGRFSFNIAGGRCEACQGEGQKRIEMHFLPDVWVTCDACGGKRYTPETLAVQFRGHSIADVLDMSVDSALDVFASVPKIRKVLQTLQDVGLGYVALGQAASTLSGGEAQRVKLAAELARPDTGRTLYILDEPTTGLHVDDVRKLLLVLHRLADLGNTVVIIEHNLDVIKTADWVIDIGPEAGARGGAVVAEGPPERIAATPASLTGAVLGPILAAGPFENRERFDSQAAAHAMLTDAKRAANALRADEPEVRMPWEVDGRAWHTRDRVTRGGKKVRWEGRLLAYVVDQILLRGGAATVDWSQRGVVRIPAPDPDAPPFFEALTAHEWIITLRFRLPKRAFKPPALERLLGLVDFIESSPPVHSEAARITIRNASCGGQTIEITAHHAAEIETAGFDEFLTQAITAIRAAEDSPFASASEWLRAQKEAPQAANTKRSKRVAKP